MSKKSKSKTKKKAAAATPEALPPEPGHNNLDDGEQQALAIQHKGAYEKSLAVKKKADADFKNVCKRAKAEMGKDAIDTIKTMIECDTPEGEARIAGRVATTITAARWAGFEIGTQFGVFAAGEMGGSRLTEEGKRAAMRGEPCKAPADATADGQQEWIKGWHAGNDARNKNLAGAVAGEGEDDAGEGDGEDGPPAGVPRKEWQRNLREQNEGVERSIAEQARRMGIAKGAPGAKPWSAILTLKKPAEGRDVAFSNFIAFLNDEWSADRPVLVVKEAMLPLEAFRKIGNAESTVRLHAGLHAVVEGMCGRFGIPWRDVRDPTVRKHFLGRANMGDRDATKLAVVARCHLLGLMPRDCSDNNRADALATHDWACANFGRRSVSTSELYFFGERTPPAECSAQKMESTRVAV